MFQQLQCAPIITMLIRFYFTICFIHTVATVIAEKPADYQVDLVQVLIANGDRTPEKDETFPKDPYDLNWKETGYGKLTKWGEKHSRRLGEVLRNRYNDFLGDYDPRYVFAFSTDDELTKKSLKKVLKGLYPRSHNPNWTELQNYLAYSEKNDLNFLSPIPKFCTRYVDLYEAAEKSPKIVKELGKYESFIWYLRMETGFPHIQPQITGSKLMNYWLSVSSMELPLPEWCSRDCLKNLYGLTALHTEISVLNNDLARMAVGPTLKIISLRLADKNTGTTVNPTKIFLYGARDSNVALMTKALKLKELPEVPDYSSALIFERLRNKKGKTFVRVLYYTGTSDQLISVQLKKPKHNPLTNAALKCINCSTYCDNECPLESFAKIVEPMMPKPEDKECIAKKPK